MSITMQQAHALKPGDYVRVSGVRQPIHRVTRITPSQIVATNGDFEKHHFWKAKVRKWTTAPTPGCAADGSSDWIVALATQEEWDAQEQAIQTEADRIKARQTEADRIKARQQERERVAAYHKELAALFATYNVNVRAYYYPEESLRLEFCGLTETDIQRIAEALK